MCLGVRVGAGWVTGGCRQLAAVHSVVFSAQAEDADGDTLMYVIDTASVSPGAGMMGGTPGRAGAAGGRGRGVEGV